MAIQIYHQTTIWGWWVQQVLDPTHELLGLAQRIEWEAIDRALWSYYREFGRYAKPIRLMVGLHILKHLLNLSDVQEVQGLHESLYWMVFCGIDVGHVLEQASPGSRSTLCMRRR
jgi:IS5 family transposase